MKILSLKQCHDLSGVFIRADPWIAQRTRCPIDPRETPQLLDQNGGQHAQDPTHSSKHRKRDRWQVADGYWDEQMPGFGDRTHHSGRKSFIVRYSFNGTKRRLTLGTYPVLSLSSHTHRHPLSHWCFEVESHRASLIQRNQQELGRCPPDQLRNDFELSPDYKDQLRPQRQSLLGEKAIPDQLYPKGVKISDRQMWKS